MAVLDNSRFEIGLRLLARSAPRAPAAAVELLRLVPTLALDRIGIAISVAVQIEDSTSLVAALSAAVADGALDNDITALLELMPDETIGLAVLAATVADRVIRARQNDSITGQILMDASNRFSDAGRSKQALSAARASIVTFRSAETTDPVIASALSNLPIDYGKVALSRRPSRRPSSRSTAFPGEPEVAEMAIRNNAAFRMLEAGRYDDARDQQLRVARALGEASSESSATMRIRLQSILSNGICLESAVGNWDEAARSARQLVATRRQDFSARRDRNTAYLARALANAALPLARSGAGREARTAIAEARALHRLTAVRAPIFRFEAAESACIDALLRRIDGDDDGAIAAAEDAARDLEHLGTEVGDLSSRLAGAITASRDAWEVGDLKAIGSIDPKQGARFPLLLEYKDL